MLWYISDVLHVLAAPWCCVPARVREACFPIYFCWRHFLGETFDHRNVLGGGGAEFVLAKHRHRFETTPPGLGIENTIAG